MVFKTTNDWERYDKAELVSLGAYSLFVSTSGPPRKLHSPVVVFITGGGAPTKLYIHLQRAISQFARTYFWDRAGYGSSERHPKGTSEVKAARASVLYNPDGDGPVTAQDTAIELKELMQGIQVHSPYILIAHSYGGIIARTYFDMFPGDVAGMALLDTNSDLLQQCLGPIPPASFASVTKGIFLEDLTNLRRESGMTDAEWDAAIRAVERSRLGSADEATHLSGRNLARCRQPDNQAMGEKPLIVLCSNMAGDFRLMLKEGLRLGGGTKVERCQAEQWVESAELFVPSVQRVQLELSRNALYSDFRDVGHDFPVRQPVRTAGVVKRLLDVLEKHSLTGLFVTEGTVE